MQLLNALCAQRFVVKNFPEPHQLLGFKDAFHPNNIQGSFSQYLLIPRSKWDLFDKDTISLKRKVGFHRMKIHAQDFFGQFLFIFCPQVALFVTGFPCTPFSWLHNNSALLADDEAQQFYETVRRIKRLQPCASSLYKFQFCCFLACGSSSIQPLASKAAVLENVLGLYRVLDRVMRVIQGNLPGILGLKTGDNVSR